MDRRMRVALAAALLTMLVLVVAASSGPVRVWVIAPADEPGTSIDVRPNDTAVPATAPPAEDGRSSPWAGTALQLFAVLASVGVAAGIVMVAAGAGRDRPWRWRGWPGWRAPRWGRLAAATPPTDAAPLLLAVDIEAARFALSTGTPREAIVRCWLQLEADASAVGLPRFASETSAEYVERVVRASSLDPGPIGELAALYREARFSRHELGDVHRARALAALHRVGAALRRETPVST